MSTTTLIKDTAIDRYRRQLERDALRRIGVCSTGYSRAAQPFIVECRIDDGQVVIRDGWRQAMKLHQELDALIHLVQRGEDRRSIMIRPEAPHIVGADADGCAIAVCWPDTLTAELLTTLLDEADNCSLTGPLHIYASACTAPIAPDLYRFYQVFDPWAPPELRRHQLDDLGQTPAPIEPVDQLFEVEITATATVRQRRQIRAQTPEAAIAAAAATASDHVWEYIEVNDNSIDGIAVSAHGTDPTYSPGARG